MKRYTRFGLLLVPLVMQLVAMDRNDEPRNLTEIVQQVDKDSPRDGLIETEKARKECENAILTVYKLATAASNKLMRAGWSHHYDKYSTEYNAIRERESHKNPDIVGIQFSYFTLKHRAEKRSLQNPFEMLAKTYWRGALATVAVTTALAVPVTYAASCEIYKRFHKCDEEDFGDGLEDRNNREDTQAIDVIDQDLSQEAALLSN